MAHAIDDPLMILPYFACLRPDERMRGARRLTLIHLAAAQSVRLESTVVIVLSGRVLLIRDGAESTPLRPGDTCGELDAFIGSRGERVFKAETPATLATLDRASMDALLEEFPVMAGPLMKELGHELAWRNDMLREICLARNAGLSPRALEKILSTRRARLERRRHRPSARVGPLLIRALITEPARRPSFWMFAGAALALICARSVVALILKKGLQKYLFALIGTAAGNPIHVHHFIYGLLLVTLTGLLSLIPRVRPALRTLSFLFGFGVGLVADEFALLWNLNPDYYQPSSRLAAAVVLSALIQIVYFRAIYAAIGRRLLSRVRS